MRAFFLTILLPTIASCKANSASGDMWWVKCSPPPNPSALVVQIDKTGYFKGKRPIELTDCVDVPAKIDASKMKVITSVFLGDLNAGDLINYSSIMTVTNESENYHEAWLVERHIVLANKFDSTTGVLVRRGHSNGNCTTELHHCALDDNGMYKVLKPIKAAYLNIVVYAAGSNMINAKLVINKGYADIEGHVVRPVAYIH